MSNEKRSSAEVARNMDRNLLDISTRLKEKTKELKAILEEANKVYPAPDELKKLSLEDQTKVAKQMEDVRTKLSLAIKSLEGWQNTYQKALENTKKAREALSNSERYKPQEGKSDAGPPWAKPSRPSVDRIPQSMKGRNSKIDKADEPKLKTDDDQSPRKQ